ncbi:hypothetical protein C8C83_0859 [Flavobacterium sp. 90]|uniref:zinc ribbon domain-containing protein n=1 Tax=unclassified Flavobacterium TaxID=196869 RepID=UPI000EB4F704|nr:MULTISPECIES: zinc ribbon domain-containing protein [unclassified Flavobacterium]RKR09239.1 hypothetical protein C8C82_1158 [Flavobacterium sp. 81]TCK53023.1 hypothetical protein C8C83_0859 [Flavobacterium sp. 90]
MKTICSKCEAENDSSLKYCSNCGYELSGNEKENITPEIKKEIPVKSERKFSLKTFLGFIVGFAVMFFVTQSLFKPSIDKQLTEIANEMNKSCPIRVDEYTTLKSVVALPEKTIQYNYILGLTKAEVKLDTVKKYIFPGVLQNVKNSPEMKPFRDNKVTLNYHYTDKNGDFVTEYIVKPELYE